MLSEKGLSLYRKILKLQYSALIHSQSPRSSLIELINQKEVVGELFNQLRLALQRRTKGRPAQVSFFILHNCWNTISIGKPTE